MVIFTEISSVSSIFTVHPLIQVPNMLVGAPLGVDITLVCNVEASPKAINYWQRENGECSQSISSYHAESDISFDCMEINISSSHSNKLNRYDAENVFGFD